MIGERQQLTRGVGRQPTRELLPIHLRRRTVWERCRTDEGRAEQVHRGPKAPHNLDAGLVRGSAQDRCLAVHAG